MSPKVSVIAIAYNHAPYIKEALASIEKQYPNLQLILMDDASSDNGAHLLKEWAAGQEEVTLVLHDQNVGYTETFNEGLALAEGDYIIDFALDDVMLPGFIQKSVDALEKTNAEYGLSFANADYIDKTSTVISNHFDSLKQKGMIKEMPQGDVFEAVLKRYFIATPTMVIKRKVFDRIGGYDPELAYEDFDFWVRSSRYFKFLYLDEVLIQKRKIETSMSANRLKHWQNEQLDSVYQVCEKTFALCKGKRELKALKQRLAYEYRQCIRTNHSDLAAKHIELTKRLDGNVLLLRLQGLLISLGIDFKRV